MNTKKYPALSIDDEPKAKNWKIPAGKYRAVLESADVDKDDADILRFRVTQYCGARTEYWVRNRYRKGDRDSLVQHIISWRGLEEFNTLTKGGCLDFKGLYGQEADIEVKCLKKCRDREALRVIKMITPPGSLVPDAEVQESGSRVNCSQ